MAADEQNDLPAAISKECRTPLYWVSVRDDGSVCLKPDANADVTKVARVIKALKARGVQFIGIGNSASSGSDPIPWD